jgi:predicted transcriptional regulator
MKLSDLRKIGLTDGEIKVYQALLDLKECTKTALAKASGIAPSNIYDVTNRLLAKGIISKVEKNGVAHFSAANPSRIMDFLEQQEKEISQKRQFAQSLLPQLMAQFQKAPDTTAIEVFQGWNGLATIFKDLLDECKAGDENFVFGASEGAQSEQSDRFFLKYSRLREKKGIVTSIIFNEGLRKRSQRLEFFLGSRKYKVRFLDQKTWAEVMVYKNKTALLILGVEPIGIRITGKDVAESFFQYFQQLWKQASA